MLDRDLVLPHLLAKLAREHPDRIFVQQVDGPELTYAELHERNLLWADAFRRLGVGPQHRVATMLPTTVEAYNAWMGLSWLRAIEVPLNSMYRGRMLAYVVDNCDATVLVIGKDYIDRLADVAADLGNLETVVVPDGDEVNLQLPFEVMTRAEFLDAAAPAADLEGPAHSDVACIIYTSGTTGPSKGVLVPWAELYWFDLLLPDTLGADGAYYTFFAPFHVSGKLSLYIPAKRQVRLVLRDGFSRSEFWNDVRRYACTACGLVGPLARLLLLNPERPDDSDNPLRSASCGPLFPEIDVFRERFGVEVGTGYGMTEIGAVTATEGFSIEDWRSCGKARTGRPGYELRVVDEQDEPVEEGVIGELIVRCDEPWCMSLGYYGMPEKTAESWRNGWFHTGDGFRCDENGNFYFVDRLKDAIRRRGENISSFEVEAYVNDHPDVEECAAIGVPSELGEDEVKVCVVRRPDSSLDARALIEYLLPNMPRFMVPRFVELVDALPKTDATARTRKIELRENALNERTWDRDEAGVEVPR